MNALQQLCTAAVNGDLNKVRHLLPLIGDINEHPHNGMTPLICAIEGLNLATIEYLIDQGADINIADPYGQTPLHWAIDIEMDEAINGDLSSPSTRVTELLLRKGAEVNVHDYRGETPLDCATIRGHHEAVQLLGLYSKR